MKVLSLFCSLVDQKSFQTLFKSIRRHSWQQDLTFTFPVRNAHKLHQSLWIKWLNGYFAKQKGKQCCGTEWIRKTKLCPLLWKVDEQFYSSQHCLNLATDVVRWCQHWHVWSAKVFGQMVCVNLCLRAKMQPVPAENCLGRKREEQFLAEYASYKADFL